MKKIIIMFCLIGILVLSGCESSYQTCYSDCIELETMRYDDCSYMSFSWKCDMDEHFYEIKEICNKRCG